MDEGAILSCYVRRFVETKVWKPGAIYELFGVSADIARKTLRVYSLVCKYNLILYAGVYFTDLCKWRSQLIAFLKENPKEAYYWTGGDLTGSDSVNAFAFDNIHFDFTHVNKTARAKAAELKNLTPQQQKKAIKAVVQDPHTDMTRLGDLNLDDEMSTDADNDEDDEEDDPDLVAY